MIHINNKKGVFMVSIINSFKRLWEEGDDPPPSWGGPGVLCTDNQYLKPSFREAQAKRLIDHDPTLAGVEVYWINRFCKWEIDGEHVDRRLRAIVGDCAMDALSFLAKAIKNIAKVLFISIIVISAAVGGAYVGYYCASAVLPIAWKFFNLSN